MDKVSNRDRKVANDGLAEAREDCVVDLAREPGAVERVNGQGHQELHQSVNSRICTWILRIGLQVLEVGADSGRYQSLQVKVDKGLLDGKETGRLEASHAEDVHRDLELAHLDLLMQVHVLDRLLEAEVILNYRETDKNFAGRWRLWCES